MTEAAYRMSESPGTIHMPSACTDFSSNGRSARDASGVAARLVALAEAVRQRKVGANSPQIAAAETSLAKRIRAHLETSSVDVTLTDNHYTMISVRRVARERRYQVRLHHMFAEADPVITRALARYIADNDRDASRVLGDFIDGNAEAVRSRPGAVSRPPTLLLITAGDVHDLRGIYDQLNATYFDGSIDASITWGPRIGTPRRRRSIKMGTYAVEDRLIRIHRALDRAFVPRFVVEWIVYHEMLHQVHDIKVVGGRREFHSKAFLADERRFARYAEARAWERRHLDALLTY